MLLSDLVKKEMILPEPYWKFTISSRNGFQMQDLGSSHRIQKSDNFFHYITQITQIRGFVNGLNFI